jgi:hypothetical protein
VKGGHGRSYTKPGRAIGIQARLSPDETRQCARADGKTKRGYPTRQRAKRAAHALRDRGGPALSPYSCGDCGFFHLGNSRSKQKPVAA